MQDTSAGVGTAFRRAIARLLPQAGATLIVAVAFILLLFVAAFCGGGALLKEAQHLSSPALGSTVSIQQTLLWIVIIMLAGLVALPITTVTAFAALGIALENDGPWTALINAVAILSAPSTRRYFIWFAIVSGFAYPVIAIQLNLATMIASALYLPMASTLLAAIFYTPATIIIALFSVRVWRVADARRAVAAASAAAAPSWVSLALAYLSLCVFTYGAVRPHYGFVWTTMTIPTAARPFPPQGHERYQSYATCARENFPTGTRSYRRFAGLVRSHERL